MIRLSRARAKFLLPRLGSANRGHPAAANSLLKVSSLCWREPAVRSPSFDLRQETYIFVKDLPVSCHASGDWANVGRNQGEIEAGEATRMQSLKLGSKIDIWPDEQLKHGSVNSETPQHVMLKSASTERELVGAAGANYVRIAVTDHAQPLGDEVDRFVLGVRALPQNAWAHFHCEAGLERTTVFMVLYDMLRNANRVSLKDIVRRLKPTAQ
jgi:hypothetical protein